MLDAHTTALLECHAEAADRDAVWPTATWTALRQAGVLGWCVPRAHGGADWDAVALLAGYESLAAACLTTAFLLSQREAACRRLRDGDNPTLAAELLPSLARGETFATVGLSQLTTSRQHGGPALRARLVGDRLCLDGSIPWVTGAAHAAHVVLGATLDDGRQVLAVLPRTTAGVVVGPAFDLMALQGSLTAEVHLHGVELDARWLLAGPVANVTAARRGSTGGLETSCLALGLTKAATAYLAAGLEKGTFIIS
jgi:alkylation response protein AidB-like acyl-CoA dehydrogenase